jgi:hypothetical protein
MVSRQPGRPSEMEVSGAIMRLQANDYMVHPTKEDVSKGLSAMASACTWLPQDMIQHQSDRLSRPYFDDEAKRRDTRLIACERVWEEPNLDETFGDFVLRRLLEFNQ